jgi:hypothetical protein
MTGNGIKIGSTWYPITRPEIWQACRTEQEYFRILADRQKKGSDYEPLTMVETEEQKQIPSSLF